MRGCKNQGYGWQLLKSGLLLFLMLPAVAEQLPPQTLILPLDSDQDLVGRKSQPQPVTQNSYCDPALRNRLISLATAAKVAINVPENLQLFGGWLDLAQAVDQEPCTEQRVITAIRQWQGEHRDHPAALLFPELFGTQQQALHLAVLLPLQGEMEGLSQMILAGMGSAADVNKIKISLIDSMELLQNSSAENRANALDNFDCAIGPLERERVEQFALSHPSLPVLTLNYLPAATQIPQLFQIALRPEDEGYAVADLAAEAGHKHGVLLYTEEQGWSERMASAVMNRWDTYGGTLEPHVIDARQTDFSAELKEMLQIAGSERRHKKIENLLGYSVKFEPRRREDIEFVIILVDQLLGRMLKPQLKFWYAGGLPVYAASRILSANSFTKNSDLDGVQLTLPPWIEFEGAQMDIDSEAVLEHALNFLGKSAIRIVQQSNCLLNGVQLLDQSAESAWVFDRTTRRFHYRSRHAVIKNNRLSYKIKLYK